ncbi:MAG TPA: hypothetical protein VE650_04780 [Acetobacteraceae bacterium]|jgi:hypothetical protein|nr:hypothetical protein [Acetobacteraceae bacterium]
MARAVSWRDPAVSPPGLWFGMAAAPLCWFAQHLLVSTTVSLDCHRRWIVPAIWALCAGVLLVAFVLSWRALRRVPQPGPHGYAERRSRFVGLCSCIMPVMFLLLMTWQLIAGLVYSGCER